MGQKTTTETEKSVRIDKQTCTKSFKKDYHEGIFYKKIRKLML